MPETLSPTLQKLKEAAKRRELARLKRDRVKLILSLLPEPKSKPATSAPM